MSLEVLNKTVNIEVVDEVKDDLSELVYKKLIRGENEKKDQSSRIKKDDSDVGQNIDGFNHETKVEETS